MWLSHRFTPLLQNRSGSLLREGSKPNPHPASEASPGSAVPQPPACCLRSTTALWAPACRSFHVTLGPVCSSVQREVCRDDVGGFLASAAAVLQFGSKARRQPLGPRGNKVPAPVSLSVSETGAGGRAHIPPDAVGKHPGPRRGRLPGSRGLLLLGALAAAGLRMEELVTRPGALGGLRRATPDPVQGEPLPSWGQPPPRRELGGCPLLCCPLSPLSSDSAAALL